jgi:hypothetical protein
MQLADLYIKFLWCNIYKPYSKFGRKRVNNKDIGKNKLPDKKHLFTKLALHTPS